MLRPGHERPDRGQSVKIITLAGAFAANRSGSQISATTHSDGGDPRVDRTISFLAARGAVQSIISHVLSGLSATVSVVRMGAQNENLLDSLFGG